jgi:ATP-dependent Clp protease ATP-binding subunit ClpB
MDFNKFTLKSQEAVQQAQSLAEAAGNGAIETGHLLKGIFLTDQDVTPYLFKQLGVDPKHLAQITDRIVQSYSKVTGGQLHLSQPLHQTLNKALESLKEFGDDFVSVELLLYALVQSTDAVGQLLKDQKITTSNLKQAIMEWRKSNLKQPGRDLQIPGEICQEPQRARTIGQA